MNTALRLISVVVLSIALALGLRAAHPAVATPETAIAPGELVTWRGGGVNSTWSNPANWKGGAVPRRNDMVRFPSGASDALLDSGFDGIIGGLIIEHGYQGTLSLARPLTVRGELSMEGGTLASGTFPLTVEGKATVTGGVLSTPNNIMSVTSLEIEAPGVVVMSANGKLNLTGNGTPLTGDGHLDTTTNQPNSVEYTGHATSELTAAGPASAYHTLAGLSSGGGPARSVTSVPAKSSEFLQRAAATFTETSHLILTRSDDFLNSAVIDAANGFAYLGTATYPGMVVKIRLSDFTRVGALTLNIGEDFLESAAIDPANGFAYFGTVTPCSAPQCAPGTIVKIRPSDFTRVGALTLNPGEYSVTSALMDAANGFAYFGVSANNGSPGSVVKVRLSDFARVSTLTFNAGEYGAGLGLMDAANGFAYFVTGCYTAPCGPATIVKVRLSDFTRVGALTLNTGEDNLSSSVIDPANGFAYFGTGLYPGTIVKVRLSDFTRVDALTLPAGESSLTRAVIDAANGYAYFVSGAGIVKIRLSDFTRIGTLALNNTGSVLAAVIDPGNGFAYFGTSTYHQPASVYKVRLSDFSLVAVLQLEVGDADLAPAAIDPLNGFAYFGTRYSVLSTSPATVVKVRLSDLTRVGALTLNPGESNLVSMLVDPANGFAYFGLGTSPGTVVKVRLSDFTRVSALTFNAGEIGAGPAVIDTANGFAYFVAGGYSVSSIIKVRLSDFTRVGALPLNASDYNLMTAVIDTANGFAYFGTNYVLGIVVKIRLSDFTRVGALTLNGGEDELGAAVIDTANGFAYFGTGPEDSAGTVIKLRLSDFTRVGALYIGGLGSTSAVIDVANGFAYFGNPSSAYNVVKVRLSDFTSAGSLTLDPGTNTRVTSAVIDPANGFAYFGTTFPSVVKVKIGFDNLVLTPLANVIADAGDVLTYTLTINNDSLDTATGLTLTDTLPLSVTFNSVTPGPSTCNQSSGQVICNLGTLAAGDSAQVTIQVTVASSGRGIITNTASASASEPRFNTPTTAILNTLINPSRVFLPLIVR